MSERVRITDVAPRDGLQNEPQPVDIDQKLRLVELLVASGVDEVEVSSFVSPKWVPQLADAAELFARLETLERGAVVFSALVPNERGLETARQVNANAARRMIDKLSVFTAASETFSQKNTNATIAETIERFRPILAAATADGLPVRGYVSCAWACPFEGPIRAAAVIDVCQRLLDLGAAELDVADTIGAATPDSTARLLEALAAGLGDEMMRAATLHLHDTHGLAGACARTALDYGLRSFDSAAGGLGGCPYAKVAGQRAPGNLATNTLLQVIRDAGLETGVDAALMQEASALAQALKS